MRGGKTLLRGSSYLVKQFMGRSCSQKVFFSVKKNYSRKVNIMTFILVVCSFPIRTSSNIALFQQQPNRFEERGRPGLWLAWMQTLDLEVASTRAPDLVGLVHGGCKFLVFHDQAS